MNMIYKKQLKQYLKRIVKSKNCFTLKILTFKKDRYLLISYNHERYTVVEDGFERKQFQFNSSDEAMREVIKRADIEFKHSYRLYTKLKKE